jgi:hypothetical protein
VARLYGRAGRLKAEDGGFRLGQAREQEAHPPQLAPDLAQPAMGCRVIRAPPCIFL